MPTSGEAAYIDTSALVKLFVPEPETAALTAYLATRPHRVSALLLRTEALRAAVRAGLSPSRMLLVHSILDGIAYLPADVALSDEAGMLAPPDLRSLDALHLAAARHLGSRLEALITYDQRLGAAAAWYGIAVVRPA